MNPLNHLALIPDGNRRWARKRNLPEFFGHREGAETGEKILEAALELKIPYVTFWGLSLNNALKRSKEELDFLFKIFGEHFKKLLTNKRIFEEEVNVGILGRWRELFPEEIVKTMEEAIEKTKHHKKLHLTFLMAYGGFDEMLETIKKIADEKLQKPDLIITNDTVKKNLWAYNLPPVDLVVRTGGEPHWSNGFMMWDVGDAQFHSSETLWPDFSEDELKEIVRKFRESERRFGK